MVRNMAVRTIQSMISGVLLYGRMKSIGILDLHNKAVYFETLVPLKTLRIHNRYLLNKVPRSISRQISLGFIKANYDSIITSSIDLE